MAFLDRVVKSREYRTETELLHRGGIVSIAIVLVGMTGKPEREGTGPYIQAAAIHSQNGARTVYLLGYNEGANFIRDIANEAKEKRLIQSFEIDSYSAVVENTGLKHTLARMAMIPDNAIKFLEARQQVMPPAARC